MLQAAVGQEADRVQALLALLSSILGLRAYVN